MAVVNAPEDTRLLALLHELNRLDLDLMVRDLGPENALRALSALGGELREIHRRTVAWRSDIRGAMAHQEQALEALWGTRAAAERLRDLVNTRRRLVDLDAVLGPCQVLAEEVARRCSRREPETTLAHKPPGETTEE